MPDIVVDRTTYIKIGNAEPITTGIAEGSMLIDRVLFVDDFRFGQFASSRFEIQVYGLSNVARQKIEVYQMSNDTRTDLFVGEIESSKLDNAGYYRDIIAYDMFYFIAKKDVSSWFNGLWTNNVTQISVLDAFKSLLTYFNLSYDTNTVKAANFTGTLYKDSIVEFEKISFKDMVKYMLEPLALIPYVDASGKVAVYSPSMASSVNLASKYDKNASVFEEYEVEPMQWVGIVDIDSAVIQQAEISGNTSDIRYDLPYNPLRLDLYSEEGSTAKTAVLNNFISKANFAEYTPCEVTMIVSDMAIKLGDKITTARGTSYVSEITLSGPMLVEQQIISRGSPIQQEVEEDYDPVFSYLSNKITENENELANLQDEIDNYEPSEDYTNKVSEFSSIIAGGMGLKSITYKQQDGSYVKYYYAPATAQSTSIAGSRFVFTMKSSGFAWTDNWQGTADASSEGDTVWISGFSANGNALLKMLSVYKLTADQINAGAITVGGLGQDVIDFINQGGEQDDGIDVHGTVTTYTDSQDVSVIFLSVTTEEQIEELEPGMTVELTFPNGVPFSQDLDHSYLYKSLMAQFDGGTTRGTNAFLLLNANGTTDWCNVKDFTDYASSSTIRFIVRDNLTGAYVAAPELCELIEAKNVENATLHYYDTSAGQTTDSMTTGLVMDSAYEQIPNGTVRQCDISSLSHGFLIWKPNGSNNYLSPSFYFDDNTGRVILSKNNYDSYSTIATDHYQTAEYEGAGSYCSFYRCTDITDSVCLIFERYRTSEDSYIRAFELRFDPVELVPTIDPDIQRAIDASIAEAMEDIDSVVTTFFGTCNTSGGTATKVVNTSSDFVLRKGVIISIKFDYEHTSTSAIKLNVNNSGAFNVYAKGSTVNKNSFCNIKADSTIQFIYDGNSHWVMSEASADVMMASWCAANDVTKINGSKIYTGTVAAEQIASGAITTDKLTASNAMLANLLAKTAAITGTLNLYGYTTNSVSDTNIYNITNNSSFIAAVKILIDYDNIPAAYRQTLLTAGRLAYGLTVYNARNAPLKLYLKDENDQSTLVGSFGSEGLVFAPNGLDQYDVNNWTFYGSGGVSVRGKSIKASEIITTTLTAYSGTFGPDKTIQLSGYTNSPTVFTTIQSASADLNGLVSRVENISSSSFDLCLRNAYGTFYSNCTATISCLIFSND